MSAHDETDELAKTKAELSYALHCLEREIAIAQQAQSQIASARKALEFYANPYRYDGPNMSPIQDDPFQPENLVYRMDVTRDHGHIARAALKEISK